MSSVSSPDRDRGDAVLFLLRVAIGWHFLYEGITKLLEPGWTAAGYLQGATGPLAGVFQSLAGNATLLKMVDLANIWGLVLIGGCLMLGLFTRLSAAAGMALLALYYLSNPPLIGSVPVGPAEGHYLLINKNLVELVALLVVIVLPARRLGLDGLFARRRVAPAAAVVSGETPIAGLPPERSGWLAPSRREVLARLAGVPIIGGMALAVLARHGWKSREEEHLADAASGPTIKEVDFSKSLQNLKGQLPQGSIGKLKLSRMILGGNLMGGWAHARDLIYVSTLVKAYHRRGKIFETFRIAEACGVNTILTNPILCDTINDYWRSTGGKIQFISDCGGKNVMELIQKSIDHGAAACYVQGGVADALVAKGQFDVIAQALELIRKNGLPAGIGGHKLETIKQCVERKLLPDFWMKTLHRVDYWSAKPKPECDNIWCDDPKAVAEYMKGLPQPWIAFKILAAGAIQPKVGFKFAFENGADFICVGMYDFQVVDNVNLALSVLGSKIERERVWHA